MIIFCCFYYLYILVFGVVCGLEFRIGGSGIICMKICFGWSNKIEYMLGILFNLIFFMFGLRFGECSVV